MHRATKSARTLSCEFLKLTDNLARAKVGDDKSAVRRLERNLATFNTKMSPAERQRLLALINQTAPAESASEILLAGR